MGASATLTAALLLVAAMGASASEAGAYATAAAAQPATNTSTGTPHLMLVVVDDLGYGDIGYNNDQLSMATPTIDRLAAGGVTLTQFYASPTCTASRAALLTGKYPMRLGLQDSVIHSTEPRGVPLDEPMLAERLGGAGYRTALFGKWHLGMHQWAYTPNARGFDEFYGILTGGGDHLTHESTGSFAMRGTAYKAQQYHFSGKNLWHNEEPVDESADGIEGVHSTDLYTMKALQYLRADARGRVAATIKAAAAATEVGDAATEEDAAEEDTATGALSPWFMMLAYQAVHAPIQAPDEYMDGTLLTGCNHIVDGDQTRMRRKLCGMVAMVDASITQLVDTARSGGQWADTALIFLSDNGGILRHGSSNAPLRGEKGQYLEGGIRVPAFLSGGFVERSLAAAGVAPHASTALTHITDIHTTLLSVAAVDFASVEQVRLRRERRRLATAGGDRRRLRASADEVFDAEAAAAEITEAFPGEGAAQDDVTLDGVDQWAALVGTASSGGLAPSARRHICHNINSEVFGAAGALRIGDYKLLVEPRVTESEIYEYGQHMLQDDDWDADELNQVIHQKLLRIPGVTYLFDVVRNPSEREDGECDDAASCSNLYDDADFVALRDAMLTQWDALSEATPASTEEWLDDGPLADPAHFGGVWTPWRDDSNIPYAVYSLAESSLHSNLHGGNAPKRSEASYGGDGVASAEGLEAAAAASSTNGDGSLVGKGAADAGSSSLAAMSAAAASDSAARGEAEALAEALAAAHGGVAPPLGEDGMPMPQGKGRSADLDDRRLAAAAAVSTSPVERLAAAATAVSPGAAHFAYAMAGAVGGAVGAVLVVGAGRGRSVA